MSLNARLIVAIVVIAPTLAPAQTRAPFDVPPAPVGHRQPTASEVPAGDSFVGGPGATGPGSPVLTTPEERRDNAIDGSLCATPTC